MTKDQSKNQSKIGILVYEIFQLLRFEYLNIEKKLSDDEIKIALRKRVHLIEKGYWGNQVNFIKSLIAKKYYFEAKNRGILSHEESDWCEHILFGAPRTDRKSDKREVVNNKLANILKDRRSVRSWQQTRINKEIFEDLIEAAKWAPSSCNRQPYDFIVTDKKEHISLIYKIKRQKFLKYAPYYILVLINKDSYGSEEDFIYFSGLDAGAAIQNLLLKAEELNLGACWINWKPKSISDKEKKHMKNAFKLPDDYEVVSVIAIGEPKEKPFPPGRKDSKEMLHFEEYGSRL